MEIIEFFKSENKSTSLKIISIKLKKYYDLADKCIRLDDIQNKFKSKQKVFE